jgi:hypothetical protein
MREFLAIVTTLCAGLFVTMVLAHGLEHRQLASNRVDTSADVRPGIVAVSRSGYAVRVLDKPVPLELLAIKAPGEI